MGFVQDTSSKNFSETKWSGYYTDKSEGTGENVLKVYKSDTKETLVEYEQKGFGDSPVLSTVSKQALLFAQSLVREYIKKDAAIKQENNNLKHEIEILREENEELSRVIKSRFPTPDFNAINEVDYDYDDDDDYDDQDD